MTISRLLMPAVTLAGALALAGCGGGSGTPTTTGNGDNGGGGENKPPECKAAGVILNDAGDDCIPDPGYVDPAAASKERTANAKALMAALNVTDAIDPANPIVAITTDDIGGNTVPAFANLKKTSKTVAALAGWKGAEYKGSAGDAPNTYTAEVVAYDNKASAETQPFSDSYAPHATNKFYTFQDGNGPGLLDDDADKISIDGIDANGEQTISEVKTFTGTYDGASGTYACPGNCTVTSNEGKVVALSVGVNSWRFTPAEGVVAPKASSAAYLQFGWWVRKEKDGSPVDAGTFARESAGATAVDTENRIGSATYRGGAAGKFAVSDSGSPANDNSGHFTANATLEAAFGNTAGYGKLKGTIDGFTLNDTVKGDWVVSLEEQTLVAAGVVAGSDDTASRTRLSLDGENFAAEAGTWTAGFYSAADDTNNIPKHVIGEFEATLGGGTHHMEGAFGANRE